MIWFAQRSLICRILFISSGVAVGTGVDVGFGVAVAFGVAVGEVLMLASSQPVLVGLQLLTHKRLRTYRLLQCLLLILLI